jgi:hypothetical protein
LLQRQLP